MLEESSVTTTDRCFAIAPGIPCKTDSGCRIEPMRLHATVGDSRRHSTLHDSVRQICDRDWLVGVRSKPGNRTIWADYGLTGNVVRWIKIVSLVLLFTVGFEQTQAQTEIHGELVRDAPVVLEIRFKQLVTVVVLD